MVKEPTEYSEGSLIEELREWWDEEVIGEDDPFANPKPIEGTIFDIQPAVDSLGVVKQLITIEKHVGFEVSPSIIKRGGYRTFDEMISHLIPRVRALHEQYQKKKVA